MISRIRMILALLVAAVVGAPALAQQAADTVAPEAATRSLSAQSERQFVGAELSIIAAANPLAVEAGAQVLAAGGTAADAAIAVQLMLGLVEPQSSGLGGGAFLVYWDATTKKMTTLDGRETAPSASTPTLFQDDAGEPLKFFDAVVGGRSVGVPGTPKLLAEMHARWGKSKWAELLQPAIARAENGFAVSPRLNELIGEDGDRLKTDRVARDYFFDPAGGQLEVGAILKNPDYAATLRTLADQGMDAFYSGPLAAAIVEKVRGAEGNPGVLALDDLAGYRVVARQPVCVTYRIYEVCGMGPPSSGGLTVGQILGLLQPFDMALMSPDDPQTWRLIGDASRLAFADRGRYMADSDFVPMPVRGLLDPAYLATRAELLRGDMALESVEAGTPEWDHAFNLADDEAIELPSTSHFVIQDQFGNIVSMTTTIENGFGSRLMVGGFLLNNELTDFSFRSHKDGVPIANRVEPGKRPRSSMAPTIVLQQGTPVLAVGSPGGSRIIPYVARTLIAILDWRLDVQTAIDMPHLVNRFGTYDLEAGTAAEAMGPALEALGYKVNIRDLNSGLHAIALWGDDVPEVSVLESGAPYLAGAADSRREGVVFGQGALKCEPVTACIR